MAKPKRWIALLRGINVGGKNKLKMVALAELFESLGCSAVQTYIQSGNLVFESSAAKVKSLPGQVESAILDEFGLRVPIIIRSAAELRTAVENNPFDTPKADIKALSVGFLKDKPTAARIALLDPKRSPGDRYQVEGGTVYLHCPNGIAKTKLTSAYFDRTLDTVLTVRNWKTTNRLLEMVDATD